MRAAAGTFDSPDEKNSTAASAGMSRTSRMFFPPRVYSSTEAWKPLPSQTSHGADIPAITPRSE